LAFRKVKPGKVKRLKKAKGKKRKKPL